MTPQGGKARVQTSRRRRQRRLNYLSENVILTKFDHGLNVDWIETSSLDLAS